MERERLILTVSQLNAYIRARFDEDKVLANVYVRGEISNFTKHLKSGHLYMTLKDSGGAVRAVMFRSSAQRLKFSPQNGMKVIARGRVSVFERDGNYQLYLESIEPDGTGALHLAYEQLKEKLFKEGLFDEARKRPMPLYPMKIGIVTSPTGAAIRDMLSILSRRFPLADVVLCPALVQGEEAPWQIIKGIELLNRQGECDVIIIGRGGGSIEDLWAFNDEGVARSIAASQIPVISAVGHETDFTISDFVADLRAPTPSAAAELVVPDAVELKLRLKAAELRLNKLLKESLEKKRAALKGLVQKRVMASPRVYLDDRAMTLLYLCRNLTKAYELCVARQRADFAGLASKLDALSPLSVLARGYAIVYDDKGEVVKSSLDIEADDMLKIGFSDGAVRCRAVEVENL